MLSLNELETIANTKNVIFYKPGCPYCAASKKLMDELKNIDAISEYEIYYLDQDFDNRTLTELVEKFGWHKTNPLRNHPTKPQIFINETGETEYIPGNDVFYKSKWNTAGEIEVNNKRISTPNWPNPMS